MLQRRKKYTKQVQFWRQYIKRVRTKISISFVVLLLYEHVLGSWNGAVMRALSSHQCGPGSIPGPGVHKWVEFVVGSRPCFEGFLRVLRFSSLHKNQHSKFKFDLESVDE